jgi:hypothetical protein
MKLKTKILTKKAALKQIQNYGPFFTSNLYGDIICRYCELNQTVGGKKHKKGCPWVVFKKIKL